MLWRAQKAHAVALRDWISAPAAMNKLDEREAIGSVDRQLDRERFIFAAEGHAGTRPDAGPQARAQKVGRAQHVRCTCL